MAFLRQSLYICKIASTKGTGLKKILYLCVIVIEKQTNNNNQFTRITNQNIEFWNISDLILFLIYPTYLKGQH